MSQMETHIGKLRKVILQEGETLEKWCEKKCNEKGILELSSYLGSWKEEFIESISLDNYFFINGEAWEAFDNSNPETQMELLILY